MAIRETRRKVGESAIQRRPETIRRKSLPVSSHPEADPELLHNPSPAPKPQPIVSINGNDVGNDVRSEKTERAA